MHLNWLYFTSSRTGGIVIKRVCLLLGCFVCSFVTLRFLEKCKSVFMKFATDVPLLPHVRKISILTFQTFKVQCQNRRTENLPPAIAQQWFKISSPNLTIATEVILAWNRTSHIFKMATWRRLALCFLPCDAMQSAVLPWQVVRPSVCDVEVSWSYRLEFCENNFTAD